jgi:hypothetical protein
LISIKFRRLRRRAAARRGLTQINTQARHIVLI